MPRDSRLTNPEDYLNDVGKFFRRKSRDKMDYVKNFSVSALQGEPPFNVNRFGPKELTNKLVTKKLALNPRLNFTGNQPEEFELFAGLGRFNRSEDYSFDTGMPNNPRNFTRDPEFNEFWVDAYRLSPTIKPSDKIKDPMPSAKNPDPRGYIMAQAEGKAEAEAEGKVSVETLLSGKSGFKKDDEDKEDKKA
jgi:hypothetical protein